MQSKFGIADPELRPSSKSYLFMTKIRKINSIDRNLRRKWSKLQQQRIKQSQQNQTKYLNAARLFFRSESQISSYDKTVYSPNTKVMKYPTINPNKISSQLQGKPEPLYLMVQNNGCSINQSPISLEKIRIEKAHNQKKNLEEIYYRKKERKPFQDPFKVKNPSFQRGQNQNPPNLELPLSQCKSLKISDGRIKLKTEGNIPHHLKKREKKIYREYQVINKKYQKKLENITKKKGLEQLKIGEEQVEMLRKLKKDKIYFKLTTSWETNKAEFP